MSSQLAVMPIAMTISAVLLGECAASECARGHWDKFTHSECRTVKDVQGFDQQYCRDVSNPIYMCDEWEKWTPGRASPEHPHVVAADSEGKWRPEEGYNWVSPGVAGNWDIKWSPGVLSSKRPNVVASDTEGKWQPASGYVWACNPPSACDLKVKQSEH